MAGLRKTIEALTPPSWFDGNPDITQKYSANLSEAAFQGSYFWTSLVGYEKLSGSTPMTERVVVVRENLITGKEVRQGDRQITSGGEILEPDLEFPVGTSRVLNKPESISHARSVEFTARVVKLCALAVAANLLLDKISTN